MAVSDEFSRLDAREQFLLEQIAQVERVDWIGKSEGWPCPSVSWRDGKYLILWFSLPAGRKAVYVGCEDWRVSDALRGVQAQKRLVDLRAALSRVHQAQAVVKLAAFQARDCLLDPVFG